MTATDDAQALIARLDAFQASLATAAAAAGDAGDVAKEKQLDAQADRAALQLEAARQSLLAAIDGGADVTSLLAQMAQVNTDPCSAGRHQGQPAAATWIRSAPPSRASANSPPPPRRSRADSASLPL